MLSGFQNEYEIEETLGCGAFSTVKKCKHKKDGSFYCVKIITKLNLTTDEIDNILCEIDILQSINHENIIKLISAYDEPESYFIVAELLSGGELFARMAKKSAFTEKEAIDITKTLLSAISYLHEKNITHRDLKPENIILRNEENESDLKIADFGMAKRVTGPKSLKTKCGTPLFIAPEVIKGTPYDSKCDLWSLGVIIYTLLCGYEPFRGKPRSILYHRIANGNFRFPPEQWDVISDEAKSFVKGLIEVDPEKRMSANDALQHEWVCSNDEKVLTRTVSCDWLKTYEASKRVRAAGKMKRVLNCVRIKTRLDKLTSKINAEDVSNVKDSVRRKIHCEKLRRKLLSEELPDVVNSVLKKTRVEKLARKLIPEDRSGIIDLDGLDDEYTTRYEADSFEGARHLHCSIDLEKSIDLNEFDSPLDFGKRDFESSFQLGNSIGFRGFESIGYATNKKTNTKHAVRVCSKCDLVPINEEALIHEIYILRALQHDNIVRLDDVYDDPDSYFLVTGLEQENLFDRITTDQISCYNERTLRNVCKALLDAVSCCHENKIAHRDIKLENVSVCSYDDDGYKVKLGNFGFATKEKYPDCLVTLCGTPEYVAAEIIKGDPYSCRVDMWSFGVMVYVLLSGTFPFYGDSTHELYKRIVKGDYDFLQEHNWDYDISSAAKDFVKQLLVVNPKRRKSAEDALKHEWIRCIDSCLSINDLQASKNRLKTHKNVGSKVTTSPSLKDKLNSLGPIGCIDGYNESLENHTSLFISLKSFKLNGWM